MPFTSIFPGQRSRVSLRPSQSKPASQKLPTEDAISAMLFASGARSATFSSAGMPWRSTESTTGTRGEIEHVPRRKAEADRKVVAEVALALAADRHVHRDHQRVVAELPRALDQTHRDVAVLEDVGLEPQAPSGLARDALDRGRGHGRQGVRYSRGGGRARDAHVGERPAESGPARGPDGDGEFRARAENGARGIDLRDPGQHPRGEARALEGGAVVAQRRFVLGAAVEEIEDRARQPLFGEPPQVLYRPRAQEAPCGAPGDRAGR